MTEDTNPSRDLEFEFPDNSHSRWPSVDGLQDETPKRRELSEITDTLIAISPDRLVSSANGRGREQMIWDSCMLLSLS